ncbi:MAG: LLM class F420-dependent oxidoreductase [Acidimicrobiales bacterium]|jgi:probable F420-dependent oxidoreductase|nr:LLM class F420-dependent oxidoreductase [Acidimicrobiales bacterium]
MKFGAGAVNSLLTDDPMAMRDYAQAADGLKFDFLTLIDHVVLAYPTIDGTPRSRYPAQTPFHDILVALGYLAGVTSRIRLRAALVILPQRGPAVVAKQIATADILSGGRIDVGLGIGWHEEEYDALEVPFSERGKRMDEGIELMKQLWSQEHINFDGDFYQVDEMAMEPKPFQQPHPPIWIGGTSQPSFRRVVEHGVGWLSGPAQTLDEMASGWNTICSLATAHGRNLDELRLHVSVGLGPEEPTDQIIEAVSSLGDIGATDVSFFTSYLTGIDSVEGHIAQLERAMSDIVPAVQAGR